jgi:hypothetical protein
MLSESEQFPQQRHVLQVPAKPLIPLDTLQLLFTRLDTQCAQMGIRYSQSRTTLGSLGHREPGFDLEIPPEFTTVVEARNSMDFLWNSILHYGYDLETGGITLLGPEEELQRQALIVRMSQWNSAFQCLLLRRGITLSALESQASKVLQIQQHSAMLVLVVTDFLDDMVWDQYTAHFETMLNLASEVAAISRASFALNGKSVPNFSLDSIIVGVLFHIGYKCREPTLRRRAIDVLGVSPRQEGVWDGVLVGRVLKRIVDIEEKGLGLIQSAADVPAASRISNVDVKFDREERKAVMIYIRPRCGRPRDEKVVAESVKETITW